MGDKEAGLLPKYKVERTDGQPIGFCFVLEPGRDPAAIDALSVYACAVEELGYKALAAELFDITRRYRSVVCHDCAWTGVPEQMNTKRGKRCLCPSCDGTDVRKAAIPEDLKPRA